MNFSARSSQGQIQSLKSFKFSYSKHMQSNSWANSRVLHKLGQVCVEEEKLTSVQDTRLRNPALGHENIEIINAQLQ